ncbi:hypothetical protein B0H14DRAFT_2829333 [Mycena olivaceomarginata]|nr:hypothetical protein B0H14DRAFT_2829333 [Mycena olivaceomarginata]
MHRMAKESSISGAKSTSWVPHHSCARAISRAPLAPPQTSRHPPHALCVAPCDTAKVGAAQRLSIYEQGTSQVYLRGAASSLCAILGSIIFSQTGKEGKERDDNAQPRAAPGARSGDQCAQGRVRPQRRDVIAQHREHLRRLIHPFVPLHAVAFSASAGMLSCSAASTSVGSLHPVVPLHATVFSALRAGEAERADPALDPELGGIEDSASERELEVRGTEAAAECGGNGVKGCEAQVRCRCGGASDGRREGDV